MINIYKILYLNKIIVYIGQTKGFVYKRFNCHCNNNKSEISKFIQKHGKENFSIELVEVCKGKKEASRREKYWIKKLNTLIPNGYNKTIGGHSTNHSQETKQKISKAAKKRFLNIEERIKVSNFMKNRIFSEEHKKKLSKAAKGRIFSEEHKENLSRVKKGRERKPFSEEHKENLSRAKKGKNNPMYGKIGKNAPCFGRNGKKHPMYGKKHSEEIKIKISKTNKGRIFSEEHKENLSKSLIGRKSPMKGRKHSEETKQKMSKSQIGRKHSQETKDKLSKIAKERNRPNFSI